MDVLSVYQFPQRKGKKDEEYAHLVFFNIPKLTLTTARGQVNACEPDYPVHPAPPWGFQHFLSQPEKLQCQSLAPTTATDSLSLCLSPSLTHANTHTYTHKLSLQGLHNSHLNNLLSSNLLAAICLSASAVPCVRFNGLLSTIRNSIRRQCWKGCGKERELFCGNKSVLKVLDLRI